MSGHHHYHVGDAGDRNVLLAVVVNMGLTVAQVIGGVVSGSLSLIADALHNFSDAISLIIAYAARRIARRPSDEKMTFGYVRAEVVAALINYTTLIVIGLYLVYEAVLRFIDPNPIDGWIVVAVAAVALVVDAVTAALTFRMSKSSMNIRAAFLHNLADALGSVGVIVAGALVLLYDWILVDPIVTLLIAGYILWQAAHEIGGSIRVLMLGSPPDIEIREVIDALVDVDGVRSVHHVHLWSIDEREAAVEAHVVVADETGREAEDLKRRLKDRLRERFGIEHSTLEIERAFAACDGDDAKLIGHSTARSDPRTA